MEISEEARKQIARNISEQVKLSRKNRSAIAREMDVTPNTIYAYCEGKGIPSLLLFKKLCIILGCHYEDILGEPKE